MPIAIISFNAHVSHTFLILKLKSVATMPHRDALKGASASQLDW